METYKRLKEIEAELRIICTKLGQTHDWQSLVHLHNALEEVRAAWTKTTQARIDGMDAFIEAVRR